MKKEWMVIRIDYCERIYGRRRCLQDMAEVLGRAVVMPISQVLRDIAGPEYYIRKVTGMLRKIVYLDS